MPSLRHKGVDVAPQLTHSRPSAKRRGRIEIEPLHERLDILVHSLLVRGSYIGLNATYLSQSPGKLKIVHAKAKKVIIFFFSLWFYSGKVRLSTVSASEDNDQISLSQSSLFFFFISRTRHSPVGQ